MGKIPLEERSPIDRMQIQSLKTVGRERVPVVGMATIQLTIEKFVYEHDVVVMLRFGYEVVLGLDFLLASELSLNISCGHITLTFENPDLEPLQQNEEIPEINLFHELTFPIQKLNQ